MFQCSPIWPLPNGVRRATSTLLYSQMSGVSRTAGNSFDAQCNKTLNIFQASQTVSQGIAYPVTFCILHSVCILPPAARVRSADYLLASEISNIGNLLSHESVTQSCMLRADIPHGFLDQSIDVTYDVQAMHALFTVGTPDCDLAFMNLFVQNLWPGLIEVRSRSQHRSVPPMHNLINGSERQHRGPQIIEL